MKHIEKFESFNTNNSLNENHESDSRIHEFIKEYIIGELIEEHEFTDVFLEKEEVKNMIEMNVKVLEDEIMEKLEEGSHSLGKVLLSLLPK